MALNPVNDQFQISQSDQFVKSASSVASDGNGNFVAVWHSREEDGDGFGIYGRRFQADGTPIGNEFRISTTTQGDQVRPTVGMDANGGFVVAWNSEDNDGMGIFAQRFQADGTRIGGEFQVNTTTEGEQSSPKIAVADNGNFTITWGSEVENPTSASDFDIYARSFAQGASARDFRVNEFTEGEQNSPSIAVDAVGNFVIAWESDEFITPGGGPEDDRDAIVARLFTAGGNARGDEFLVNGTTEDNQFDPGVGMADNGNFVVTWGDSSFNGDTYRLFGRQFGSSAINPGREFVIASSTDGTQGDSAVSFDDNGNFVVAWSNAQFSNNQRDIDISARRYNPNGTPDTDVISVNNIDGGYDNNPTIASDADGDVIISWTSRSGIEGRLFSPRTINNPGTPGNPGNPGNPSQPSGPQIGTSSADRMRGTNSRDVMRALGGDDSLTGRGGNDRLVGGGGNDSINGGGGNDTISGGGGSDRLLGKAGNDKINGGGGNDYLDGGSGVDVLKGGGGVDTFVLRKGKGLNRIKDFSQRDRVSLKGRIDLSEISFEEQRKGILVRTGNDDLALFEGIKLAQIEDALGSISVPFSRSVSLS